MPATLHPSPPRRRARAARRPRRRNPRRRAAIVLLAIAGLAGAAIAVILAAGRGAPSREGSEAFRLAVEMHQALVEDYQYDCFARPEYEEVARLLGEVRKGEPRYAEAQAMLRRYIEQRERIRAAETIAAKEEESGARAALAMRKGFEAGAELYRGKGTLDDGRRAGTETLRYGGGEARPRAGGVRAGGGRETPARGELGPGDYVAVASGAQATAGKDEAAQAPPAGGPDRPPGQAGLETDADALRQRQMDAAAGWKCYASSFGPPSTEGESRYKVRLGDSPDLWIAGARIRTLADLRAAVRQGSTPSRDRDEFLMLLAPYSDGSLAGARGRFNPLAFLLIARASEGYVQIDFLSEYDRCYGSARYREARRNPPGGPLDDPDRSQSVDLGFPEFAPYAFAIRMARLPEGVAIALDCRTPRGERTEVCRFLLPQMVTESAAGTASAAGPR